MQAVDDASGIEPDTLQQLHAFEQGSVCFFGFLYLNTHDFVRAVPTNTNGFSKAGQSGSSPKRFFRPDQIGSGAFVRKRRNAQTKQSFFAGEIPDQKLIVALAHAHCNAGRRGEVEAQRDERSKQYKRKKNQNGLERIWLIFWWFRRR